MRFINYLAIVALAAAAASAAPVIESKETFPVTLHEGHLNPEAMEKRFYRPPVKRANTMGYGHNNPNNRQSPPVKRANTMGYRHNNPNNHQSPPVKRAIEKRWASPRPVKAM
jgi:hypothetical protein